MTGNRFVRAGRVRLWMTMLLWLAPLPSSADDYERYAYVPGMWGYGTRIIVDPDRKHGGIHYGEDTSDPATFCEVDSGFVCVVSEDLLFAVPRPMGTQDQWVYEGVEFKILRRNLEVTIFGKSIGGLSVIGTGPMKSGKTAESLQSQMFLYSESMGLVAFGYSPSYKVPGCAAEVSWLKDGLGFGAQPPGSTAANPN